MEHDRFLSLVRAEQLGHLHQIEGRGEEIRDRGQQHARCDEEHRQRPPDSGRQRQELDQGQRQHQQKRHHRRQQDRDGDNGNHDALQHRMLLQGSETPIAISPSLIFLQPLKTEVGQRLELVSRPAF